ncbi:DoxX family membrane protein [Rhodococcus sp. 2H158]
MIVRRIARPMLASVFVAGGIDALRDSSTKAAAAQPGLDRAVGMLPDTVAQKLPDTVSEKLTNDPETLVRINAAVQIGAGALLAVGKAPRLAALALATTLVPTTVAGHDFWNVEDAEARAIQRTQFLKNVSLLGGLIITAVDTEGKPSLGWRGRRAARRAQVAVAGVLPHQDDAAGEAVTESLHKVAERVRTLSEEAAEVAGTARERGSHLLGVARERGPELAEVARERGTHLLDVARERGPELADVARERGTELLDVARERGPELADVARERGTELLDVAKERGPELAEVARERSSLLWGTARERGPELAKVARERALTAEERSLLLAQQARHRAEEALTRARLQLQR